MKYPIIYPDELPLRFSSIWYLTSHFKMQQIIHNFGFLYNFIKTERKNQFSSMLAFISNNCQYISLSNRNSII